MTSALLVVVVFLAILTFGNLLLCFAVIRRLRSLQELVVPTAYVPEVGTVIEPFEIETTTGANLASGSFAVGPVLLAVLSTTCGICHTVAKELGSLTGLAAAPVVLVVGDPQADNSELLDLLGGIDQVAVLRGDHPAIEAIGGIRSFPTVLAVRGGKIVSADTSLEKVLPSLKEPAKAGVR